MKPSRFIPIIAGGMASIWTPALLPSIAPSIDIALARLQGKLWQDLAKTIPAVNDNDPIAVAKCPFTGVDWNNTGGTGRPLLTNISGNYWGAKFNATSLLKCTYTFTTPNTTTFGFYSTSGAVASYYYMDGDAANARTVQQQTLTTTIIYNGVILSLINTNPFNVWRNTTAVFNGASSSIVQGASNVSGNAGNAEPSTTGLRFGVPLSGAVMQGILSCCVNVNGLVSSPDQALLTNYVNGTHP